MFENWPTGLDISAGAVIGEILLKIKKNLVILASTHDQRKVDYSLRRNFSILLSNQDIL